MSVEKVKQLEELVSSGLRCLENFYNENCRLEERVRELEKEKVMLLKENGRAKSSLDKVNQLEVSLRKLTKDCSTSRTKIKNILQKINKMDLRQVQQSSGLNLEKIKNLKTSNGKTLYSIRMSKSFRAVICIEDDFIRFISLHPDHDSAYK